MAEVMMWQWPLVGGTSALWVGGGEVFQLLINGECLSTLVYFIVKVSVPNQELYKPVLRITVFVQGAVYILYIIIIIIIIITIIIIMTNDSSLYLQSFIELLEDDTDVYR